MIEVTMEELLAMSDVLARLSQHRFPAGQQVAAYRLSKIQKAVASELQYFQTQRKNLIEELGKSRNATRDELASGAEPVVWEIMPGNPQWVDFTRRLKELLGIKVDLTCPPLSLDMLGSVELSAGDFGVLDKLLVESEIQKVESLEA